MTIYFWIRQLLSEVLWPSGSSSVYLLLFLFILQEHSVCLSSAYRSALCFHVLYNSQLFSSFVSCFFYSLVSSSLIHPYFVYWCISFCLWSLFTSSLYLSSCFLFNFVFHYCYSLPFCLKALDLLSHRQLTCKFQFLFSCNLNPVTWIIFLLWCSH